MFSAIAAVGWHAGVGLTICCRLTCRRRADYPLQADLLVSGWLSAVGWSADVRLTLLTCWPCSYVPCHIRCRVTRQCRAVLHLTRTSNCSWWVLNRAQESGNQRPEKKISWIGDRLILRFVTFSNFSIPFVVFKIHLVSFEHSQLIMKLW